MIRQYIAALWVAVDVALTLSFAWFIFREARRDDRSVISLAAGFGLLTYFIGALMSRLWSLINLHVLLDLLDTPDAAYVAWPLALVGAALGLSGALSCVWIFSPRTVRGWLWFATIMTALAIGYFA